MMKTENRTMMKRGVPMKMTPSGAWTRCTVEEVQPPRRQIRRDRLTPAMQRQSDRMTWGRY